MDVIRNLITRVLAEQNVSPSTSQSTSNRTRGSRLQNKFGLNITQDELVASKLKEQQKRESRRKSPKQRNGKNVGGTKKRNRRRRSEINANKQVNNEENYLHDHMTTAALRQLDDAIQFTQTNINGESSDEENIFSAMCE